MMMSCSKKIPPNSYWIAVKSYPIPPSNGNRVLDGIILHFEKDSIEIGNVYFDGIEKNGLKTSMNEIYLNDTLTFKIFQTYEDSIFLDYDIDTRVKLIRLGEQTRLNDGPELFKTKHWELIYDDPKNHEFNKKLILTDLPFYNEQESFVCINKSLANNRFLNTAEKWKFQIINGNHLFVKTQGQLNNEFYRITKYLNHSTAKLKCINCNENITATLKSIDNIEGQKKQKILENISNKEWRIAKLSELDTISSGTRYPDDLVLQLNSLKNNDLSFIFSDDFKFIIKEYGITKATGNWNLSSTGQEIILNKGQNPSDYIDLISVSSDSMKIGNLRIFEPETQNYGMILKIYYKAILKVNDG